MVGHALFFVKTLVTTFVVVVFLQVQWGQQTIESHLMGWIHQSEVMTPVQEAAHGGVVGIRELWKKLTAGIRTNFKDSLDKSQIPGHRNLGISLERSSAYLKEKAKLATEKIKAEIEPAIDKAKEKALDDYSSDEEWVE